MLQWYEIPPAQRTDEQNRQCQQAYRIALLSTPDGKQVVCDMKRRIAETIVTDCNNVNFGVTAIHLEAFFETTLRLCGVNDPMRIVEAQSEIARSYVHKNPAENTYVPEDHSE
jgi:hypothetical protein